MSLKLLQKVLQRRFPTPALKLVLLAMAFCADDRELGIGYATLKRLLDSRAAVAPPEAGA